MPDPLALTLPRTLAAGSVARAAVQDRFGADLTSAQLEALELVVSELVTNAVLHGEGEVELRLAVDGQRIRGEVIDQGGGFEREVRDRGPDELGGRGLQIVEALSARWGIHEGTTHVWFELAPPSAPVVPAPPRLGEDERPTGL
jgi:anti-sigma regulatory factor (Ser/Thr protein kinase)